jgi:transcriptional regulator with XRE-family HTH domain
MNVKSRRLFLKVSQEAVSLRCGLSLSDIGRVERGERDPGVVVLSKLAFGLRTVPAELLRDVSWVPPKAP